jgi:DNA-binding MarR family transcriptional regulator
MTREWTFLTSHALVLLEVARDPECLIRDLAERLDLTERTVHTVLKDLIDAGYLQRSKESRSYRYHVLRSGHLRHPRMQTIQVRDLLNLVQPIDSTQRRSTSSTSDSARS